MPDSTMMILKGSEVESLLSGQEDKIMQAVRTAYESHAAGKSSLPHSTFLRFPDDPINRIIALPAYLGGPGGGAGIKWVSSFPGNLEKGIDRASAVIILNSVTTGRPHAILEASIISAKRTAASAALAAHTLHTEGDVKAVALIGCGPINFEIQRFLLSVFPSIRTLYLYDLEADRAIQFKQICKKAFSQISAEVVTDLKELLGASNLVSIATTAARPYITDLSALAPRSTVLHISLRDLAPEVILACDNVVDDVDHVCRAQTSAHLAEQLTGARQFIRCSLADVTTGRAPARRDADSITVFSPFGLGVLDIAVANLAYSNAIRLNQGTMIESFLPAPWTERI